MHHRPASAAAALVLLAAAYAAPGCGHSDESDVVDVLERRCSNLACHGVSSGTSADGKKLDPNRWLTFVVDGDGRISDREGALASARAKVSAEAPRFSSLLRKTLPPSEGGVFHFQGSLFSTTSDPDYQSLAAWAESVFPGGEGADVAPLSANEQRFASDVYPFLMARGCATATCHGSLMFGGTRFSTPAVPGTLDLPRAELRETYRQARQNLTLWGLPERSRLLAKILPLESGGVLHKGGNDVFFAAEIEAGQAPIESEAARNILDWLDAERATELGDAAQPVAREPSIVAVGGPIAAAAPFDVAPYTPGTSLYRLDPPYAGPPANLTQSPATADVRDPAVSHDGKTIAFSMRTSATDAHNVYTVGIDGSKLRQLTHDSASAPGGLVIGNFAPTFGPGGGFAPGSGAAPAERIYFSSTRAADRSDRAAVQNADLYAMDVDGSNLERLTYTLVPEVAPTFLAAGEFAGTMAYTIERAVEGGYKGVFFRFPIDHNRAFHVQPEAHPHFGMSEPPAVFYRLRELPDGRAATVLLDADNRWRGGQIALLERQFAVEVPDGQEAQATLPGFRHALTVLTPGAAREKVSADGMWADPTPLPDGTLLAAHAPGPFDLAQSTTRPRTALVKLTLATDRATNRPVVASTAPFWSDAAMSLSQPVAVVQRGAEDPPHPRAWDDTSPTATLVHSGVQVIEAVLAQLPPVARRTLRDDIALVRVVAPLSAAGPVDATSVPAAETRAGLDGATSASLTGRMPLFIAAEVPPAADGSLAANIPPKVSVRVVTLDADGLALGALQHQWYATLPGERFPVGIPLSSFDATCAGCHGAMDGSAQSVLHAPTDFVTQASVTAALYVDADRRKPRDLPTVDGTFFKLVDFRRDVQPVLDAKCATSSCHSGSAPAAGLSLTGAATAHYTDAYESLLARGDGSAAGWKYVDADGARARGSYLAERIMNREYEASHALTGPCPPVGSPPLTADEKTLIVRWIELGAAFVGTPAAP